MKHPTLIWPKRITGLKVGAGTIPKLFILCLTSAPLLASGLLQEAVQEFPANTSSLEYDNLSSLRRLPNYGDLRKQYSGESLDRAKRTLSMLGISEDQLSEVVTASSPGGFFGVVSGSFSPKTTEARAARQHFSRTELAGERAYCSEEGVCVAFQAGEAGIAIFGSLQQLRTISAVRSSQATPLSANSTYMSLLDRADSAAPVIGLAPGSEIGELAKEVVPPTLAARFDLTKWFGSVEAFSYSVRLTDIAHMTVALMCKSESESRLLSGALNAAGTLQRVTGVGSTPEAQVRNISASASGQIVVLKIDARLAP